MAENQKKKFYMDKQHASKKPVFNAGELASQIVDNINQYAIFDVKVGQLIESPIREFITSCFILESKDLTDDQIRTQVDVMATAFIQQIEIIVNEHHYIRNNFDEIIEMADKIETLLFDTNSIYAIYDTDFNYRRMRFTQAYGICFALNRKLQHMANFIAKKKMNTEKYTRISNDVISLSKKIKGLIASDDKKRKRLNKKYFNQQQGNL